MDDFQKILAHCRNNPSFFVEEVLGTDTLWQKQKQIIESAFFKRRTTVASCNSAGKTFIAARTALAFLLCYKDSVVITTAPTFKQVVNGLWREIRGAYGRSNTPFGGVMLTDRYDIDANWYALGLTTKDPENARGWHAYGGHALVVVDEASGVDPLILDALEGAMTSPHVHMLYIGNPTMASGRFYDSHQSVLWNKISISVFDTPNFIANGIRTVEDLRRFTQPEDFESMELPMPMLVSPLWAWEKLQDWGEDSSLFQSLVCAQFPSQSADAIFSMNDIMRAGNLEFSMENVLHRSIGIDVARSGDDASVLTPVIKSTEGIQQIPGLSRQGYDVVEVAALAIELAEKIGWNKKRDVFVVDDIGVGGGVTDILVHKGYSVLPFVASEAGDEYHVNKRAIATYLLEYAIRTGELGLTDWGKQLKQLVSLQRKPHLSGKRLIESKEDIKKRLKESPDWADALVLGYYGIYDHVPQTVYTATKSSDTIAPNFLNEVF